MPPRSAKSSATATRHRHGRGEHRDRQARGEHARDRDDQQHDEQHEGRRRLRRRAPPRRRSTSRRRRRTGRGSRSARASGRYRRRPAASARNLRHCAVMMPWMPKTASVQAAGEHGPGPQAGEEADGRDQQQDRDRGGLAVLRELAQQLVVEGRRAAGRGELVAHPAHALVSRRAAAPLRPSQPAR